MDHFQVSGVWSLNHKQVMTIEGLKNQFVESNKALDMVQKGLNDYLETKRSHPLLHPLHPPLYTLYTLHATPSTPYTLQPLHPALYTL